uniref:Uncharacterized protein n=1 Tax=Lutzomyia ayacuchensis TaxID=252632 RepID=L0MZC4_LUTAY|nr:hypothetical protein [Lutzomyia ayacuchensis]
MNVLLKIATFLCLCELGYSWQYPRNADQTLWAFKTCQREAKDQKFLEKWKKWELPVSDETYCYVKCVWKNLGSYNDADNSIKIEAIAQQFRSRGLNVPASLQKVAGPTSGSCKEVYQKTIKFFLEQKANIQHAYYGTKAESDKWFAAHPETKPKGVKISQFCKGKEKSGCKHYCSMYYFRLVDEDNLVVPFRKLPGYPEPKLQECRNKARATTGCKVADVLYECLKRDFPTYLSMILQNYDNESEYY